MQKVNCSLSNSQIFKLLYDFEGFNYYYFQHILSDLVEQKYIINYKQEEEWLYEISPEGLNILELTQNMLPGIIIYKLDSIIQSLLKNVKNEMAVTAEYIPESGNSYITEYKKIIYEIKKL